MIAALARPGATPLHRAPAGAKLAALALVATALFFVADPRLLALAAVLGLAAARSTGAPFADIGRDLRSPAFVLLALGLVDLVFADAATALVVVLRLAALMLLAHAVTTTTSIGQFSEVLERLLAPLDRLGLVDAARAALAITLAIRFVPLIAEEAREIRDAQAARGLEGSVLALAVPLLVRIVVRSQDLADAVDARGFPPPRVVGRRKDP